MYQAPQLPPGPIVRIPVVIQFQDSL